MHRQASKFPVQVRSLQGVEAARAPPRKCRWYQRNGRGRWSASSEAQENVRTSFLVTPEQFLISGITTSGKEHNIRSEHQEWQVLVAQRYLLFPHLIFRAKKVFLANQSYCSLKFSNFWVAPFFSSALIAQIVDEQDKMQRTPLFLAAKYNHLEVVQILVQRWSKLYSSPVPWLFWDQVFFRGAKLNIGDHQKITPMLTAVLNGNIDVVTFLFK